MKSFSPVVYVAFGALLSAVGGVILSQSQSAHAQIPDQGAQLSQLIDETRSLNTKLDRIVSILEGGKLKVQVEEAKADK